VVVGQTASSVDVRVQTGSRISGRLVFEGAAAPPSGRPRVSIETPGGRPIGRASFTPAEVNEEAAFRTVGLPGGRYFVRALPPAGWTFASAMYLGRDLAREPVDLAAGDITDVVITFINESTEVTGTVRGPNGAPDPDATVIAFPADRRLWSEFGRPQPLFFQTRTTTDGAFSTLVGKLPPGEYLFTAVGAIGLFDWLRTDFLTQAAPRAVAVMIAPGRAQTVALTTETIR
jgi:hypothetical protein